MYSNTRMHMNRNYSSVWMELLTMHAKYKHVFCVIIIQIYSNTSMGITIRLIIYDQLKTETLKTKQYSKIPPAGLLQRFFCRAGVSDGVTNWNITSLGLIKRRSTHLLKRFWLRIYQQYAYQAHNAYFELQNGTILSPTSHWFIPTICFDVLRK